MIKTMIKIEIKKLKIQYIFSNFVVETLFQRVQNFVCSFSNVSGFIYNVVKVYVIYDILTRIRSLIKRENNKNVAFHFRKK